MVILLTTLLTSCETTRIENDRKVKFPNAYDHLGFYVIRKEPEGRVSMPEWYWIKIIEYGIETGGIQK